MKRTIIKTCVTLIAATALSQVAMAQPGKSRSEYIIVRTSDQPVAQVIEAINAHIKAKNYIGFGVDVVKPPQGEISMLKFCMPAIGRQLFAMALEVSALLPCGNVGIYVRNGKTEIAVLHPRYMHALYPDPAVAKASEAAEPLIMEMLNSVTPE